VLNSGSSNRVVTENPHFSRYCRSVQPRFLAHECLCPLDGGDVHRTYSKPARFIQDAMRAWVRSTWSAYSVSFQAELAVPGSES